MKLVLIAVSLLTVIILATGSAHVVVADTPATRIYDLTATESYGTVTIGGIIQYRDVNSGLFLPINGSRILLYWGTTAQALTNYIGETFADSSTGSFSYTWVNDGLEPEMQYYVTADYAGETFGGHSFTSCQDSTPLQVPLRLSIGLNNPTQSVNQGSATSVGVTVTAANGKNAHPVSLSIQYASSLFATPTFTPKTGNTPFISTLTLTVLNVTQPGTYTVTIQATSQEDSSITVSTTLTIYVQQNTRAVTVTIQGLPPNVLTTLSIDGNSLAKIGAGTDPLIISNNTLVISVTQEIDSGDTIYICQTYSQSASDTTVNSYTFTYQTKYRLKLSGDLPQNIVSTLDLNINGVDKSDSNFNPSQGYSDFLPQNASIVFGITPTYIPTDVVDYNFTYWQDLTTQQEMFVSNETSPGSGLFAISLTRPYYLEAIYDKMVRVAIKSNLPSDMSVTLQIGVAGSNMTTITVPGSVPYKVGTSFLAGSAFECDIGQDQLVLFSSDGNTRYEFQGLAPPSPVTLNQHMTINLTYSVQYKIQVVSNFPSAILQPEGGVGWFAAGDIATLQVSDQTTDKNGIPYIFEGWTGAVTSNETTVSFPVTGPMQVAVQWEPNFTYILTVAGIFLAVAVTSGFILKKKLSSWKRVKKKSVPKAQAKPKKGSGDADLKVYNYIIDKGGSMTMSDAIRDLGMSREEINDSIRRLKETQLLR